jgi:Flp pilus assembly protein CpaB
LTRKRPHFRYACLAAVLLGLAMGWSAQHYLSEAPGQAAAVPTVVAAHYIPAGTVLRPEILRVVMLPAAVVPPQAVRSPHEVLGRLVKVAIMPGEPILLPRLVPAGEQARNLRLPMLAALRDYAAAWYFDLHNLGQRLRIALGAQNLW